MPNDMYLEPFERSINYNHNDLFRPGGNFEMNACVGNNGGPYNFEDYSRGYFDSGKRLFNSIEENPSQIDVLVYPLVYVCRHAVELGLKHLIMVLPKLFEVEEDIKFTHKLYDNWGIVKNYLVKIRSEFDNYFDKDDTSINDTVEYIEKFINDLVAIDPDGQSFRFPQSKSGDNSLEEISHINVEIFYNAMKETEKSFDYWFLLLNVIWDDYQSYKYYL